ncbi:MAG: radical SAM protein [Deltaproteobacteria bacterium]|nr:radical SAM protein [Deltaproteobacteria bacterium]
MTATVSFFAPAFKRYDADGFSNVTRCGTSMVSVTGEWCALQCGHCAGGILKHARAATTPEKLMEQAHRLVQKGGDSILISGGSRPDGSVPLEPFVPTMRRIKEELGLKILVHTGLVNEASADALARAPIDCAMLDVVGDDRTIRQVLHLNASTDDFERALVLLEERRIPSAPHVVLGLGFGEVRGESVAFRMIRGKVISSLVLVLFRPTPHTPMSRCRPLDPEDAGRLFREARSLFPEVPVVLGCERPMGRHRDRTDLLAIEAGLDGIAFPSDSALRKAREDGLAVRYRTECCSMIGAAFSPTGTERKP